MSNFDRVKQFHDVFGHPISSTPTLTHYGEADKDEKLQKLRLDLIREELEELEGAMNDRDIVGVADALTDILYVVYGAGAVFGIDLDRTFDEVHRSNMSKLGADGKPIYRDDGKVLKGPSYTPPDLRAVLGIV